MVYTPGISQNIRSAPQKQPMPNTACSRPSGKGGASGVPSTKCLPGTGIFSGRPGSASSGAGISVLCFEKKSIAPMSLGARVLRNP